MVSSVFNIKRVYYIYLIFFFVVLILFNIHSGATESNAKTINIPNSGVVFVPDTITIKVGETVRWVNNDYSIPFHMFSSVPGSGQTDEFEIEITQLKSGESWEHTFKKTGEYPYFCFIHKGMVGKVIVTE